jgi:hypothetical protein
MNYQQLKYFNTLDRNKQDVYYKRLTNLETNILVKLLNNDPVEVDERLLDRFNKLTSYPKEISLECNLEDLDNLLEIDQTLEAKAREIVKKRNIIRSYINEILDKTIKK